MARMLEGESDASSARVAVVVARFNSFITDKLLDGALRAHEAAGGVSSDLPVARVPGSLELAVTARRLAAGGSVDAVVCLGCVIKGRTDHYDAVVDGTRQGIVAAAQDTGVPVIFGVLTCPTLEQAMERSGEQRNAGADAMNAALEMISLFKKIDAR